ncbi:MAG: FAD-dependent oxidoreductase [Oscillospiraceae bacterium]|nr:FAD-dependent oxidoreductase [Oscillospiraceae bacterium]
MNDNITLTIDGKKITAQSGVTILGAADLGGIGIPTLCHDGRVEVYGACGICVVEAEGVPKLLRACATKASDGMVIKTRSERIDRARKFSLDMLLSDHTGDCKAPCSLACPAGTDCQGYAGLIANGEHEQALRLIKEKIPLPAAIGRICPHPCETACRRKLVEEPVSIAALKRFAADADLFSESPYMPKTAPDSGKSATVVGGGPGGLSAAYYLRLFGHAVTVYDMMPDMGGMLRYGIPEYRLPKNVLDREIALIRRLGVTFKNNIKLGRDVTLADLRSGSDAVILAVGAWTSGKMNVPGEDLDGVFGGIDFLREVILGNVPNIGKRVGVCGGGNTAMDACRTAVRLGAEEVYVIYRRTRDEMPAEKIEIDEAEEEGVVYKFLTNPVEIRSDNGRVSGMKLQKMELGEPDLSGRRSPVPIDGAFETIELDSVIMAIGQYLDAGGLDGVGLTRRGTVAADEKSFRTNLSGVFAVGDATNKGADIAISAIGEAHKCAYVVDEFLKGNEVQYTAPFLVESEVSAEDFTDRLPDARAEFECLPPDVRKHSFDEVTSCLSRDKAVHEGSRCLECGCLDYFNCRLLRFAREYGADPTPYAGEKPKEQKDFSHPYLIHDKNKCILCGLCVRVCGERMNVTALGLAGRGFETVVSPEFYNSLESSKCIACGQCALLCPTGALMERTPHMKNVPLEENVTQTVCDGCGAGCKMNVYHAGHTVTRAEPYGEDGILCAEGRFGFGQANSPDRPHAPLLRQKDSQADKAVRPCVPAVSTTLTFDEASKLLREKFADAINSHGTESVAILLSENLTNEEIADAKAFAEEVGTANIYNAGRPKARVSYADFSSLERLFGAGIHHGANAGGMKEAGVKPAAAAGLGRLKAVLVVGGGTFVPDAEFTAVMGVVPEGKADLFIPCRAFTEKDGTFTALDGETLCLRGIGG